jgi:hypothetical protein
VNPEEVIDVVVLNVGWVGGRIRVVTLNDTEEALPVEFTAVTITLYAVLAERPVNVAELAVPNRADGEEGVAAEPFNVYV